MIKQIKNVYEIVSNLKSNNNFLNFFKYLCMKLFFTALVYHVINDNVFLFYTVNDNLNKLFRYIQTNNWKVFEVFQLFIKLHADKYSEEYLQNELTIVFGFITDEIKLFIKTGLKISYKECIKEFIENYSTKQEKGIIKKIDWNLFLKIFGVIHEDLLQVISVLR